MTSAICVVFGVAIPAMLYMYNKKWIAYYLLATCFFTEFYYINIAGGKVRFYHLASIVVILLLYKNWINILQKRQVQWVALFVGYAFVSALISDGGFGSVISWCSLVLNVCVGVAILLVIQSEFISLSEIKQAICYLMIISCIWGIVQYISFFVFSYNIGMSWEQRAQVNIGMIPAFRTEANVFGRSMLVSMFLLLPDLVRQKDKVNGLKLMYVLATFCTLINMTRTVLYPAAVVVIILAIYFIKNGDVIRFAKIAVSLGGLSIGIIVLGYINILPIADYTLYKWQTFITPMKIETNVLIEGSDEKVSREELDDVKTFEESYKEETIISNTNVSKESKENNLEDVNKETEGVKEQKKEGQPEYDISGSYRVSSTILVLKSVLESPKVFAFGKGWGNTYFMVNGYATQAGSGDWVNVFSYTGVIGLIIYLCITINVLFIVVYEIRKKAQMMDTAVGILSCYIVIGISGLLASNIIMPDFWILIGMVAYMEKKKNEKA